MKLHEHVYGEPLLLMAAPGMLARGPFNKTRPVLFSTKLPDWRTPSEPWRLDLAACPQTGHFHKEVAASLGHS